MPPARAMPRLSGEREECIQESLFRDLLWRSFRRMEDLRQASNDLGLANVLSLMGVAIGEVEDAIQRIMFVLSEIVSHAPTILFKYISSTAEATLWLRA